MGSWTVHIAGHGVHDNGLSDDVDFMVKNLVNDLRKAGHTLDAVHLNVGAGRALTEDGQGEPVYRTF